MSLKLDLDGETFDKLVEVAFRERRAPDAQAEVILRQSLGLPFPYPPPSAPTRASCHAAAGIDHGVRRE